MFIAKARDFDREVGKEATCAYCTRRLYAPPVEVVNIGERKQFYHINCVMQLVYGVLTDISGYQPAEQPTSE